MISMSKTYPVYKDPDTKLLGKEGARALAGYMPKETPCSQPFRIGSCDADPGYPALALRVGT